MSESKPKTCSDCRFALFEDYGYSNYTTEGTTFYCMKGAHPDGAFDRFYGEEKRLEFAEKCLEFCIGDAIDLDVDCINETDLSDDQKELLRQWRGSP